VPVDWSTFGVDLHLVPGPGGRRAGLEHALRDAIRSGRLPPDTRLPSTRALATELRVARGTVTAAYNQLSAEGYLSARTGSGTVVADLPRGNTPRARAVPADPQPPRHDLRPGSPDVSTFPVATWLRATRRALAVAPMTVYGYADPRGRLELRTALVEYLGRTRGVLATPDQVVVTSGYVQALSLLTTALVRAGGAAIAMEDPGLGFHRDVVQRAGASVLPLPVDDDGAVIDHLSTLDVRAAVLTPANQYPTGAMLHPRRRRAAAEWALRHDGLLIEDDYDGEFRYDRQPVGALQGTMPDRVAYLGTVSKTLAPALRLGWLVLPERWVEPVVEAKLHADLHTEVIGQLTLADLITSHGYDRHVRSCRLRYRRRRDLLLHRLAGRFTVLGVAAGLHALVQLPPDGPGEPEILARAQARGLALTGLAEHWHTPGAGRPQGIIVGYGTPRDAAYAAAIATLHHILSPPRSPRS
jgi:GntR family transcriptional regulator/MocR family aminotransferase